jgi:hypothetical protein
VAEQQLLQRDSSPMPASPVAAPDAMAPAMGNAAAEEPCSNGCADASWQDGMMQVPGALHLRPPCHTSLDSDTEALGNRAAMLRLDTRQLVGTLMYSTWRAAGAAGRRAAACGGLCVHSTAQRTSQSHAGTGQDSHLNDDDTADECIVVSSAQKSVWSCEGTA